MHLQLTLFENSRPLVDTASAWSMYSPWKRQERSTQGLLHGLYVFCVLSWMWRQVSQKSRQRIDREFALRRISEINAELSAIRALEESPALTKEGRNLLHQLLIN
jgi:HEXXH motif-containing protein